MFRKNTQELGVSLSPLSLSSVPPSVKNKTPSMDIPAKKAIVKEKEDIALHPEFLARIRASAAKAKKEEIKSPTLSNENDDNFVDDLQFNFSSSLYMAIPPKKAGKASLRINTTLPKVKSASPTPSNQKDEDLQFDFSPSPTP